MYIVGINFGLKETTASFYDTESAREVVRRLYILDGDTYGSCTVNPEVYLNRKTGEWQLNMPKRDNYLKDFINNFIGPMNAMTSKKKEAFAIFVRLVFAHILKKQEFLHYNPETGERNFEIYVALGKENIDQAKEYKNFISSIIPLDWVIPDSMAVYFKFKAETGSKDNFSVSSALVINIDSRSIDFTAYDEKGKQSFLKAFEHGSSAIEKLIYKYFEEHDENFNKAKEEALCSCENLDWRNAVIHYLKRQVETFYNNQYSALYLDLSNRTIIYNSKRRIFGIDGCEFSEKQLENEILAPYRQTLLQDMNDVKQRLAEEKNGIPEVVILTGESSRMPWLQRLVIDVFSDSQVFRDSDPSHVVSDGLAYYGTGIHKMKSAIENLKTSIATVFHEFHIQDYNTAYADYVISKMQDFLEDEHMLEYAKKEPEKQEEPIRLKKS